MRRAHRRSLIRAIGLLTCLALIPRVVMPVGAVVCIEPCGDLAVTAPHSSHSCDHSAGFSPGAVHDHSTAHSTVHSHASELSHASENGPCGMTNADGCLDFELGDDSTRAKMKHVGPDPSLLPVSYETIRWEVWTDPNHPVPHLQKTLPPPGESDATLLPLLV